MKSVIQAIFCKVTFLTFLVVVEVTVFPDLPASAGAVLRPRPLLPLLGLGDHGVAVGVGVGHVDGIVVESLVARVAHCNQRD